MTSLPYRICHFSTTDYGGGAARATWELHHLFKENGYASSMLVAKKSTHESDINEFKIVPVRNLSPSRFLSRVWTKCFLKPHKQKAKRFFTFNNSFAPDRDWGHLDKQQADIHILHWVNSFLDPRMIAELYRKTRVPLLWVLMDCEPFTGGCHYPLECGKFKKECGNCYQLLNGYQSDISAKNMREKMRCLAELPIVMVAPTVWLEQQILQSKIFHDHRVVRIPLPITSPYFYPLEKQTARQVLKIDKDACLLFVGAHNLDEPRKGIDLLLAALQELENRLKTTADFSRRSLKIQILVAGVNSASLLENLPFPVRHMGYIQDTVTLALAYQAADIFICPSRQDGGPMMLSQAMLCGTSVVAFPTGIAPELIVSGITGRLAETVDAAALARAIFDCLGDDLEKMGKTASTVARIHHDPRKIADAYRELFDELIDGSRE